MISEIPFNPYDSDPTHVSHPFEGITYFDRYDNELVESADIVVDGKKMKGEFYPRTGAFRFISLEPFVLGQHRTWIYEPRGKNAFEKYGTSYTNVVAEMQEIIPQGIAQLAEQGIGTLLEEGFGYPEIESILNEVMESEPVSIDELEVGKQYLVIKKEFQPIYPSRLSPIKQAFEWLRNLRRRQTPLNPRSNTINTSAIFTFSHTMRQDLYDGTYRIYVFPETLPIEIDIATNFQPKQTTFINQVAHGRALNETRDFIDTTLAFFPVDQQTVENVESLLPTAYIPEILYRVSKENYTTRVSLEALQFTRWTAYEPSKQIFVRKLYESKINKENYHNSLQTLINRFGIEVLEEEVQHLFVEHMKNIHVETVKGTIFKPHSDISPYDAEDMNLAREAIKELHPLPNSMINFAKTNANVLSLFGDTEFWEFLSNSYPDSFNKLVDFLQELDPIVDTFSPRYMIFQKPIDKRVTLTIYPVAVIQHYFPEAYKFITEQRSDFVTDVDEPITTFVENQ